MIALALILTFLAAAGAASWLAGLAVRMPARANVETQP